MYSVVTMRPPGAKWGGQVLQSVLEAVGLGNVEQDVGDIDQIESLLEVQAGTGDVHDLEAHGPGQILLMPAFQQTDGGLRVVDAHQQFRPEML